MCGRECFKSTARAVAKNQTFYARTDVLKKGIFFPETAGVCSNKLDGSVIKY